MVSAVQLDVQTRFAELSTWSMSMQKEVSLPQVPVSHSVVIDCDSTGGGIAMQTLLGYQIVFSDLPE